MIRLLAGIDLGGTHVRIGVVEGLDLVWRDSKRVDLADKCASVSPPHAERLLLETLADTVALALAKFPEIAALGLAVPGFMGAAPGVLAHSPNLPGIHDLQVAAPLAERLGLRVAMENDALAAAWGEYVRHPSRPESLLYLGLGTGVGAGLILDGRPYRGEHGLAMEAGHVTVDPGGRLCGCGRRGCLERYASATGIALSYQESTGDLLDAAAVARRAADGDAAAARAFLIAGDTLGHTIATAVKLLDVTTITVGGGASASWDLLWPHLRKRLEDELVNDTLDYLDIRASECNDSCGMIGAALVAGTDD